METSPLLFSLFFLLTQTALSKPNCRPSCEPNGPEIRFPFRLKDQPDRCGYPGFDLSCNNSNQTVLNLPNAGDFVVNHINYAKEYILINDPYFCLPKRTLNFSLSGSPYRSLYTRKFTFLNCSSDYWGDKMYRTEPVYCMSSNHNYTVVAITANLVPDSCRNMSTVSVPVQVQFVDESRNSVDLTEDLQLTWRVPNCGPCESRGGTCGYKGDGGEIGCFNLPRRHGLPRSAKYGIIIGAGIPVLVCLIGLLCYACGRIRAYTTRARHPDPELANPTTNHQRAMVMTGLDRSTIESYPKTVLGESKRLPKPNDDGTCPICLAEYLPKDTLRTIPECNHYFHATCIDEWLRMNATCPLCRNTPDGSSGLTPCSLTISPSSSSSTSSSSGL